MAKKRKKKSTKDDPTAAQRATMAKLRHEEKLAALRDGRRQGGRAGTHLNKGKRAEGRNPKHKGRRDW